MTKRAAVYYFYPLLVFCMFQVLICVFAKQVMTFTVLTASLTALSPFIIIKLFEMIFTPHYNKKNRRFIESVAKKFSESGTKLIAITGSFGKTCCKNILKTLLCGTYKVAATKGNYNTPMGVALSMQGLQGDEDWFIAEFGARKKGDITELCAYFPPDVGIVTGVCDQHVGVFGSFHAIYTEKSRLPEMTKKNGFCAFGNDLYAKKMSREYKGEKVSVGACEYIYAENVLRAVGKTVFTLHIRERSARVSTCLCGKQALENILLCVAVADKIGINAEEIFDRIPQISQIPHRLEYSHVNGIHILDDSYNSNTVGVKYALDYLSEYPTPRIIVAQGVVEMGIKQRAENIHIGESIASVADVAFLVGVNKRAIKTGLEKSGFRGTVICCRNLKEIEKKLPEYTKNGATVLFQNDVPDVY